MRMYWFSRVSIAPQTPKPLDGFLLINEKKIIYFIYLNYKIKNNKMSRD